MEGNTITMATIGKRKNGWTTLSIPSNILGFSLNEGEAAIVFRMSVNPNNFDAECVIVGNELLFIKESKTGGHIQEINMLQFKELGHTHYYLKRIKDKPPTF